MVEEKDISFEENPTPNQNFLMLTNNSVFKWGLYQFTDTHEIHFFGLEDHYLARENNCRGLCAKSQKTTSVTSQGLLPVTDFAHLLQFFSHAEWCCPAIIHGL